MFAPPPSFQHIQALQWSAPAWTASVVAGLLVSNGLSGAGLLVTTALLSFLAWLFAGFATWCSRFGVTHCIATTYAIFTMVCLPLSTILVPSLNRSDSPTAYYIGFFVFHATLLFVATAWRMRKLGVVPPPAPKGRLAWSNLIVHPRSQTWAFTNDNTPGRSMIPLAISGGFALCSFYILKGMGIPADATVGIMVGNSLSLWLCLGPLSESLARAKRLQSWERQHSRTLAHADSAALEQRREQHQGLVGRTLRKIALRKVKP